MTVLINPNGVIADFTGPSYWGRATHWDRETTVVEFDGLKTHACIGGIHSPVPIHNGDFILMNMTRGYVGVYEVSGVRHANGVSDLYFATYTLCGEFKNGKIEFLERYGHVKKSEIIKKSFLYRFFEGLGKLLFHKKGDSK